MNWLWHQLLKVKVAAIHCYTHTRAHPHGIAVCGHHCHVRLSEFCCDGKAAGGPLLCLYSIQVEPGYLFHSSGTHTNIYACVCEKRERVQE